MFEKLLTSLKQSLPESLRNKMGIEDENTSGEEHSQEHSSGEAGPSDDALKKKKRIGMLIRVLFVLCAGYLAFDYFLAHDDSQTEFVAALSKKPKKRKITPLKNKDSTIAEVKKEEVKPVEKPSEAPAENPIAEKSETKPTESTPPIENINIADKKVEETNPTKPEEKAIDDVPIINTPNEQIVKTGEIKPSEQVDKTLDHLIDSVDKVEKVSEATPPKKVLKLEDKIVADDVYTEAPAYDQLGRGLVYNCKEKFWACIDKTAYISCNKNMKWNKAHGKPVECAVVNVYNSEEDCTVVQKYNISTSQPVSFCQ